MQKSNKSLSIELGSNFSIKEATRRHTAALSRSGSPASAAAASY
jgi:hypothetical protein